MKHYVIMSNEKVLQVIPEIDSRFPDTPIRERYSPEFLEDCLEVEDTRARDISPGMMYDVNTNEFYWPEPAPAPITPELLPPEMPEPSQEERNRADIDYLALMMGVELP